MFKNVEFPSSPLFLCLFYDVLRLTTFILYIYLKNKYTYQNVTIVQSYFIVCLTFSELCTL
jgi:hypothetical protein